MHLRRRVFQKSTNLWLQHLSTTSFPNSERQDYATTIRKNSKKNKGKTGLPTITSVFAFINSEDEKHQNVSNKHYRLSIKKRDHLIYTGTSPCGIYIIRTKQTTSAVFHGVRARRRCIMQRKCRATSCLELRVAPSRIPCLSSPSMIAWHARRCNVHYRRYRRRFSSISLLTTKGVSKALPSLFARSKFCPINPSQAYKTPANNAGTPPPSTKTMRNTLEAPSPLTKGKRITLEPPLAPLLDQALCWNPPPPSRPSLPTPWQVYCHAPACSAKTCACKAAMRAADSI